MPITEIKMDLDNKAEEEIQACMNFENLKSFFLFAGAGSGKTRSLVNALLFLSKTYDRRLLFSGQKIGVITYTNAACDVIKKRIEFNDLFEISTIHSFVWSLINHFQVDIKKWITNNLQSEILELRELQRKGRASSKAAADREISIRAKLERLEKLSEVKKFTYNPNGENAGIDALNHSEVIKMGSDFLDSKVLIQNILISKFPIFLIDESQDTNRLLMEAFLKIELLNKGRFLLGLFGDTMQRIYSDGKLDLGVNLPSHWAKPEKKINYRCPVRVIDLINKIRSSVDEHTQIPGKNNETGFVKIFILSNECINKEHKEIEIELRMASYTGDELWRETSSVKKLILEHHMAAKRLGFLEMFEPLYKVDKLRTGLLDGSLSGIRLFSNIVFPLVKAKQSNDEFALAKIVRMYSPLLDKKVLQATEEKQGDQIKKAHEAINELFLLWHHRNPSFLEMLNCVFKNGLFQLPNSLQPFVSNLESKATKSTIEVENDNPPQEETTGVEELIAWETFLATPFNQIESYTAYISRQSPFDTHQGIKGTEFPRVMVIIDDSDTRGFLFKYDKLFGVDPKTKTDIENEQQGNDTSISRARRLFYVTCSRAEKSLAIVAYSKHPDQVRNFVTNAGWFQTKEIEVLQ